MSETLLWRLQRRFFEEQGVRAWSEGTVPHYVTSNPFIARAYAQVVRGWLRDWTAPGDGAPALDPAQPVYIVELASGSGRFAYHFLRAFRELHARSAIAGVRWTYVMTDIVDKTIAYWEEHALLQPLVEAGLLDFAYFDAERPEPLELRHAGVRLSAANPMVIVANYAFDGLAQDAFAITGGRLYEHRFTLTSPQPEPDSEDPALLARLTLTSEPLPVPGDYYDDHDLDRLLHAYAERLPDTNITLPHRAIRCLGFFRELSGGRALVLTADNGHCQEDDLVDQPVPALSLHGSFSMTVNYHALGQHVLDHGGDALVPARRHLSLAVCAFLLGPAPRGGVETRQAYDEAIDQFGPADFFTLRRGAQDDGDALTVDQILAHLRLSGWDAAIFLACAGSLLDKIAAAPDEVKREAVEAADRIWRVYYPIGEDTDLAFHLGMMLYVASAYPEALGYFQHSLRLHGLEASTLYNMALCEHELRRTDAALACLDQALALDPSFDPARRLHIKLRGARRRHLAASSSPS